MNAGPPTALADIYHGYLTCLNAQDWPNLARFVAPDVRHNGRAFGLTGYLQMLEADFRAIPDLHFRAEFLAVTPPMLASRLMFDCTPIGDLFGLAVNGQRLRFYENVFYRFEGNLIAEVWSIIDKTEIAQQLNASGGV